MVRASTIATVSTLLLIAAASGARACVNICKHINVDQIPGCDLKGKACDCIFKQSPNLLKRDSHHGKYKVDLTDPVSGTSAGSGYHGSSKEAGEVAVFNLMAVDLGCNCHANSSIPLGPCTYSGKACFYFTTLDAMLNKQAAFKVFVQVVAPVTSVVFDAIAPNATAQGFEEAGEQLMAQILPKYPQCIPGNRGEAARTLGHSFNVPDTHAFAHHHVKHHAAVHHDAAATGHHHQHNPHAAAGHHHGAAGHHVDEAQPKN